MSSKVQNKGKVVITTSVFILFWHLTWLSWLLSKNSWWWNASLGISSSRGIREWKKDVYYIYRNKNTQIGLVFQFVIWNIWNVMKVEVYFTNIWLLFLSCWLALKHSYGFFTLIFGTNRLLQSVGGRVNLCSISLYLEHRSTCLLGIKSKYLTLFSLRFL